MVMLMLENNAAVGKAFNCGTGKAATIDELAKTITDLYGPKDLEPEFHSKHPGDIKDSYADATLAKKVLEYLLKVNLEDRRKEIIESKKQK